MEWSDEADDAVEWLGKVNRRIMGCKLVVLAIDASGKVLDLVLSQDVKMKEVGSLIPTTHPSYAFLSYQNTRDLPAERSIILIYTCPSTDPFKERIYASDILPVYTAAEALLPPSGAPSGLRAKTVQITDPRELDEALVRSELGLPPSGTGEERANIPGLKVLGLSWPTSVEDAIKKLGEHRTGARMVLLGADIVNEALTLNSELDVDLSDLGKHLPTSSPSYAILSYEKVPTKRSIVLIYSSPVASKSKDSSFFASYARAVLVTARPILPPGLLAEKKIELTDWKVVGHAQDLLRVEMGLLPQVIKGSQGGRAKTGINWTTAVEDAVKGLEAIKGADCRLLLLGIDIPAESLELISEESLNNVDQVGGYIPSTRPTYAFLAYTLPDGRRSIVFIYSCPSGSGLKERMIYASSGRAVLFSAQSILPSELLSGNRIEMTDWSEVDEEFLRNELGL